MKFKLFFSLVNKKKFLLILLLLIIHQNSCWDISLGDSTDDEKFPITLSGTIKHNSTDFPDWGQELATKLAAVEDRNIICDTSETESERECPQPFIRLLIIKDREGKTLEELANFKTIDIEKIKTVDDKSSDEYKFTITEDLTEYFNPRKLELLFFIDLNNNKLDSGDIILCPESNPCTEITDERTEMASLSLILEKTHVKNIDISEVAGAKFGFGIYTGEAMEEVAIDAIDE